MTMLIIFQRDESAHSTLTARSREFTIPYLRFAMVRQ